MCTNKDAKGRTLKFEAYSVVQPAGPYVAALKSLGRMDRT